MKPPIIDTLESLTDDQIWWVYSLMAYEVECRIRQHQLDAIRIAQTIPVRADLHYLQQEFTGALSRRDDFLKANKIWDEQ
ncbi:MAG: hypothetical protein RLZ25_660 [Pseudomonadota bacterium]|jgi:hypothetical protein